MPQAVAWDVVASVPEWPLAILHRDGALVEVRALPLDAPTIVAIERADGGEWPGYTRPFFAVEPLYALLPTVDDQSAVRAAVVERRALEDNTFHVHWLDAQGQTSATTNVLYEPVSIDLGIDSLRALAEREEKAAGEARLVTADAVLAAQYLPAHIPPVSAIVPTTEGVWLQREAGVRSQRWDFVPAPGTPAGLRAAIFLDPGVRLIAASRHTFWGVRTGDFGEPVIIQLEKEH